MSLLHLLGLLLRHLDSLFTGLLNVGDGSSVADIPNGFVIEQIESNLELNPHAIPGVALHLLLAIPNTQRAPLRFNPLRLCRLIRVGLTAKNVAKSRDLVHVLNKLVPQLNERL